MNTLHFISLPNLIALALLLGFAYVPDVLAADDTPQTPNIIVILIDDLGQTDLGCYGSQFYQTPNIDRLAASGMKFTHGYSACTVCSPTRAALLTGKYPARLHVTDWIAGHNAPKAKLRIPEWTKYLPPEEVTLAEILKPQGYVCASIGKWHLGPTEEYWPLAQGFDINIGGNHKGQPPSYFFPYERPSIPLAGLETGEPGEYLTDRLTDEALRFIEANQQKPFFLYLPHYAVHTPLQAKEQAIAAAKERVQEDALQRNATYAAMVQSTDESVGRIVQKLDDLKLRDNTMIIFTSDNGGLTLNNVTHNINLRAGKGSAYEGGVRVPYIFSYPPQIKPGSENQTPIITCDLLPTVAAMVGIKDLPPGIDGRNLLPLLTDEGSFKPGPVFWHYPHYHPGGATPYGAVREGNFCLIEFYETGKFELYDVTVDPVEKDDLAATHPEVRDRLSSLLATWRQNVGAQMPTENPDYDPAAMGKQKKKQ